MIRIQEEDFCLQTEYDAMRRQSGARAGAICMFTGLVRDFGDQSGVESIYLEHYAGMTEKSLQSIIDKARSRWPLEAIRIIHRVGDLSLNEQIVLVGISSAHRDAAFQACQFIMDFLKREAPIWKKEISAESALWVEAKSSDLAKSEKWSDDSKSE